MIKNICGKYKLKEGLDIISLKGLNRSLYADLLFVSADGEYNKIVISESTVDCGIDFIKSFPYYVYFVGYKETGMFVTKEETWGILCYLEKIDKNDKNDENHEGMVQNYNGDWVWF